MRHAESMQRETSLHAPGEKLEPRCEMRHGMEGRSTYREQPNYARGSSLFTAHSNHSHDDHRPLSTHKARRSVWPRLASSRLLAPGLSACPTSCSSLRPDHALGRFPCRTLSATRARRPRPPNRLARQKILYSNLFCSIARCPSPDAAALINPALRSPFPSPSPQPGPPADERERCAAGSTAASGFRLRPPSYPVPRTPLRAAIRSGAPRSGPARSACPTLQRRVARRDLAMSASYDRPPGKRSSGLYVIPNFRSFFGSLCAIAATRPNF